MFARWSMPRAGEFFRQSTRLTGCLVLALAASGCRLPATQGPVSRSLTASRQLSQQGVSALDAGDWSTAEHLFNEAVETCDSDANAHRHYAEALWHRGKRAEALAQLDEAIRLSPEDDTLLVRAAEMRLASGDATRAQQDVRSAIDINPRSPSAWMLAGRIEVAGGHQRDALAAFHKALSLAPDSRDTLLELAECYRRLGEPERALVNLQTLADTYPPGEEPRQVSYLEGMALSAMGRQQDAVDALAQAAARGTPDAALLCSLAEAESRAGLADNAWRDVQRALTIDPRHAASRRLAAQLGLARQSTGRITR
ncbi:MAG TPA: tetratricopeptide repeat protein [Pirellulales bacterium]|jgi:tetratricopeptide (TPR) repeat protein|nr:tetratricopeptide repeat protein [Pirellulales bacterium]